MTNMTINMVVYEVDVWMVAETRNVLQVLRARIHSIPWYANYDSESIRPLWTFGCSAQQGFELVDPQLNNEQEQGAHQMEELITC